MKHILEVEIIGDRVEATLWLNGVPCEGHGDQTGTVPVEQLVSPLVRSLVARVIHDRKRLEDAA